MMWYFLEIKWLTVAEDFDSVVLNGVDAAFILLGKSLHLLVWENVGTGKTKQETI